MRRPQSSFLRLLLAGAVLVLNACGGDASPDLEAARQINSSDSSLVRVTPRTAQSTRRVIVFVHGILGDSRKAWVRTDDASGGFVRLLQSHPSTRDGYDIFLFGFPSDLWKSGSFTLSQAADLLRRRTAELFASYEEVYFVAHSMGGLVVLEFLTTDQALLSKVPAIVTYSSPFGGAQIVNIAQHVLKNRALENLKDVNGNDQLVSLHNRWKRIKETVPYAPRVKCAYETADFPGLGKPVVTFSQSTGLCDGVPAPIREDHIGIVKPRTHDDPSFEFLLEALRDDLPGPPRMSITRVADFRGSVCDTTSGERRFSEVLNDTLVFSHRMRDYSLATTPDPGMKVAVFVPAASQPSAATDWQEVIPECECPDGASPCSKRTCTWDKAARVEKRVAQVRWVWTSDRPQAIEGVSVKGRLPVSAVNFRIFLPPDVKLRRHSVTPRDFSCKVSDQRDAGIEAICGPRNQQETTGDAVTLRLIVDAIPCLGKSPGRLSASKRQLSAHR
jgi:pimeloyl-ACP methyl ester carboxylesterase